MIKPVIIILTLALTLTAFAKISGEDKFYEKCTSCHGSALSLNKKKNKAQWEYTIKRMKSHGMSIKKQETKAIAEFLSTSRQGR